MGNKISSSQSSINSVAPREAQHVSQRDEKTQTTAQNVLGGNNTPSSSPSLQSGRASARPSFRSRIFTAIKNFFSFGSSKAAPSRPQSVVPAGAPAPSSSSRHVEIPKAYKLPDPPSEANIKEFRNTVQGLAKAFESYEKAQDNPDRGNKIKEINRVTGEMRLPVLQQLADLRKLPNSADTKNKIEQLEKLQENLAGINNPNARLGLARGEFD